MLEDDVSFQVKVKMKLKPKVEMQDFHTTETLDNDTWTVMLCPKSPRWHMKLWQVSSANQNLIDGLLNNTHTHTHSDDIGHSTMHAKQWTSRTFHALTVNKNARTHTETFGEDVV